MILLMPMIQRGFILILLVFSIMVEGAKAQEKSGSRVEILQSKVILKSQNQPDVQRLIGDVVLGYEEARLYCDSAWRFSDGRFRTMGGVRLVDGTQSLTASEIELDPNQKMAAAVGNEQAMVDLSSGIGLVRSPRLRYDLQNKVIQFPVGGTMEEGRRSLNFQKGIYRLNSSLLELGGDVALRDDNFLVVSDSLHWREKAEQLIFHGPSHLQSTDTSLELWCHRGVYEDRSTSGWFGGGIDSELGFQRARVRQDYVWLEADSLVLSADSILPDEAWRNIRIRDTLNQASIYGHQAFRWDLSNSEERIWVTGTSENRVWYENTSESDTLWFVADTMNLERGTTKMWPQVIFLQGQAAALCDTLRWIDSTGWVQLVHEPEMWMDGWYLRSDSLEWWMEDQHPKELEAWGHAGLMKAVSDSCFQQIAGREFSGIFRDHSLEKLLINGNAEAIYYDEDSPEPCKEFNQSVCSRMRIDFEKGEVKGIALLERPEGIWRSSPNPTSIGGLVWRNKPDLNFPINLLFERANLWE